MSPRTLITFIDFNTFASEAELETSVMDHPESTHSDIDIFHTTPDVTVLFPLETIPHCDFSRLQFVYLFFLFLPFVTKFSRTKHRELQPRNKRHQACRNERRQTSRPPGVAISSNAIRLRIDKTKPSLCSMCWIRGVENSRYSSYILQIFRRYSQCSQYSQYS